MSGTTHQMVALIAAFWVLTLHPLSAGPVVGTLCVIAVMVGALTPDLDQPTANIWRRMLGGRAIGDIFQAFSGGHRHFTHSIIGILAIGFLTRYVATHLIHPDHVSEAIIIWRAFMVGYVSHPIADTLTDLGVPWLWPLQVQIKIPPGSRAVRVTTDSLVEKVIVRGGIIVATISLLQRYWLVLRDFFRYM
jgi:membrane-bound metal-dependent hydrolase YbcI (DUF457 family)